MSDTPYQIDWDAVPDRTGISGIPIKLLSVYSLVENQLENRNRTVDCPELPRMLFQKTRFERQDITKADLLDQHISNGVFKDQTVQ